MGSITDLPDEVVLMIFQFYMQTESQKAFLDNISNVCKAWKNICLDRYLWTKYDGTPTFKQMMYLSEKGALRKTKILILSSTISFKIASKGSEHRMTNVENTKKMKLSCSDNIKNIPIEAKLFQNVQNVEVISFSQIKQLSYEILSTVAQNCTKVREIKIGKERKILTTLNYEILVEFLSMRGYGIKKIDFSFCKIPTFQNFMQCISDCCPNLEELVLLKMDCSLGFSFPTGYVQMHCSKLKSLHMDWNIRIQYSSDPSGFSDLEDFLYNGQKGFEIFDWHLECVLFNSPKLKYLSLTNCKISAVVMLSLPALSVEYLYIRRSTACSDEFLGNLLKKWSHSLKEIDLSYGNFQVQHAVLKLIKTPVESPLVSIDLTFTPVKLDLVENIIKDCPHLEMLKLKGCRNVLRGMKTTYRDKLELQELARKIRSYRSKHPPEVVIIDDT